MKDLPIHIEKPQDLIRFITLKLIELTGFEFATFENLADLEKFIEVLQNLYNFLKPIKVAIDTLEREHQAEGGDQFLMYISLRKQMEEFIDQVRKAKIRCTRLHNLMQAYTLNNQEDSLNPIDHATRCKLITQIKTIIQHFKAISRKIGVKKNNVTNLLNNNESALRILKSQIEILSDTLSAAKENKYSETKVSNDYPYPGFSKGIRIFQVIADSIKDLDRKDSKLLLSRDLIALLPSFPENFAPDSKTANQDYLKFIETLRTIAANIDEDENKLFLYADEIQFLTLLNKILTHMPMDHSLLIESKDEYLPTLQLLYNHITPEQVAEHTNDAKNTTDTTDVKHTKEENKQTTQTETHVEKSVNVFTHLHPLTQPVHHQPNVGQSNASNESDSSNASDQLLIFNLPNELANMINNHLSFEDAIILRRIAKPYHRFFNARLEQNFAAHSYSSKQVLEILNRIGSKEAIGFIKLYRQTQSYQKLLRRITAKRYSEFLQLIHSGYFYKTSLTPHEQQDFNRNIDIEITKLMKERFQHLHKADMYRIMVNFVLQEVVKQLFKNPTDQQLQNYKSAWVAGKINLNEDQTSLTSFFESIKTPAAMQNAIASNSEYPDTFKNKFIDSDIADSSDILCYAFLTPNIPKTLLEEEFRIAFKNYKEHLSKHLQESLLNFTEKSLRDARIISYQRSCDYFVNVSGTTFDRRTNFSDCDFSGFNFENCTFDKVRMSEKTNFNHANLTNITLLSTHLKPGTLQKLGIEEINIGQEQMMVSAPTLQAAPDTDHLNWHFSFHQMMEEDVKSLEPRKLIWSFRSSSNFRKKQPPLENLQTNTLFEFLYLHDIPLDIHLPASVYRGNTKALIRALDNIADVVSKMNHSNNAQENLLALLFQLTTFFVSHLKILKMPAEKQLEMIHILRSHPLFPDCKNFADKLNHPITLLNEYEQSLQYILQIEKAMSDHDCQIKNKHMIQMIKDGDLSSLRAQQIGLFDLDKTGMVGLSNVALETAKKFNRQDILDYYFLQAIIEIKMATFTTLTNDIFNATDARGRDLKTWFAICNNVHVFSFVDGILMREIYKGLCIATFIPIHFAVRLGYVEIVKTMLQQNIYTVNQNDPQHGTLFTTACEYAQLPMLKFLLTDPDLQEKANPQIGCPSGYHDEPPISALEIATEHGHLEIVKYLFEQNVDQLNDIENGNDQHHLSGTMPHLIDDEEIRIKRNLNLIHIAIIKGHEELVAYLISELIYRQKLADIDWIHPHTGATALAVAIYTQQVAIIDLLIQSCGAKVDNQELSMNDTYFMCESGDHLLHIATRMENKCVIDRLLKAGINIHEKNAKGDTALHIAASMDQYDVVIKLIQCGADIETHNASGLTAGDLAGQKLAPVLKQFELEIYSEQHKGSTYEFLYPNDSKALLALQNAVYKKIPLSEEDINLLNHAEKRLRNIYKGLAKYLPKPSVNPMQTENANSNNRQQNFNFR